jgi:drug/metabolite transporter (DMT)-like permease
MAITIQMQQISGTVSDNIKGILWALLATALFAIVAAMAKVAVKEYHVLQILFFRQILVFLSCLPSIVKSFPGSLKTQHPKTHAARLTGAFVALSCSIWAVAVLPLTTAITLGFAQVFFVALLALILLNESVSKHRIGAVIVGFIGVVIVMRPGVEGMIDLYALIPIFSALGAGVAVISVRKLSQTESTATLLIYQSVFVGALAGVPLFWLWITQISPGRYFYWQWVYSQQLRIGLVSKHFVWARRALLETFSTCN